MNLANRLPRLEQVPGRKVSIASHSLVPAVSEQLAIHRQILARYDGMAGCGLAKIVQPLTVPLAPSHQG